MITLHDARQERLLAWDRRTGPALERAQRRAAEEKANAEYVLAHPSIGTLMRAGRLVYYVNFPSYREARDPRELPV